MPTINDVAREAGVAISTVSNIINNKGNVSEQTTQKVLKVIKELGYEADPVARNMKSTHSKLIGMVITNFSTTMDGCQCLLGKSDVCFMER